MEREVTNEATATPATGDRPWKFVGGNLALDFANTVAWPAREVGAEPIARYERIFGYSRLLDWAYQAGVVDESERLRLEGAAAHNPTEADAVVQRALRLRLSIHWIFEAIAENRHPPAGDLEVLNAELHSGLDRLRIAADAGHFRWQWGDGNALDSMLWPISRSSADLLTSQDLERVRQCAGDPCGFLFLDTSRGARRRWCVMQECGNRAKARRHYHRSNAADAPAG